MTAETERHRAGKPPSSRTSRPTAYPTPNAAPSAAPRTAATSPASLASSSKPRAPPEIELAAWLDEAETERVNDGADVGVLWIKRRGRSSPGDGFVIMSGDALLQLLSAAGYIGSPGRDRLAG
jgi:hypothetical protein